MTNRENRIILVTETGFDIPPQPARELGIILISMHVTMGDKTLPDGPGAFGIVGTSQPS